MPELQDIPLELGGRSLTIRFSYLAQKTMKHHWQLEDDREIQARLVKPSMEDVAVILWAGLRRHHPEMGLSDVENLLDDAGTVGMTAAVGKLGDAIGASSPPESNDPK